MHLVRVYDLPLRIFHILFAIFFLISFSIGKFVDDESLLYSYHMLSGMIMSFLVLLRVIWGLWGSKYSRFSSFNLNIKDLFDYFKHILTTSSQRVLGHNSASSFAAIFMFILTFLLFGTGLMMTLKISKEFFEEIHEIASTFFILTVIAHIFGVILHQVKHKDNMIFSMFSGKKTQLYGCMPIEKNYNFVAIIFIVFTLSFASLLLYSFDRITQNLNMFNTTFELGRRQEVDLDFYNNYYELND